jgi:hypothetical protein
MYICFDRKAISSRKFYIVFVDNHAQKGLAKTARAEKNLNKIYDE